MTNQESDLHRRCSAGKYSTICQIVEKVSVRIKKQWIDDMQYCGKDVNKILSEICESPKKVKLAMIGDSFTIEGCYAEIQEIKTKLEQEHGKAMVEKKCEEERKRQKENKHSENKIREIPPSGSDKKWIEMSNKTTENGESGGSRTQIYERNDESGKEQLINVTTSEKMRSREDQKDKQAAICNLSSSSYRELSQWEIQSPSHNKNYQDEARSSEDSDSRNNLNSRDEDIRAGRNAQEDMNRETNKSKNKSICEDARKLTYQNSHSNHYRHQNSTEQPNQFPDSSVDPGSDYELETTESVGKDMRSDPKLKETKAKGEAEGQESERVGEIRLAGENSSHKTKHEREVQEIINARGDEKQEGAADKKVGGHKRDRRLKQSKSTDENNSDESSHPLSNGIIFTDDHFTDDSSTAISYKKHIPVDIAIYMHLQKCWVKQKSSKLIIEACSSFGFNQVQNECYFEFQVNKPKDMERVQNTFKDIIDKVKCETCWIPDGVDFITFKDIIECENNSDNISFVWDEKYRSCKILGFAEDEIKKSKVWIARLIAQNSASMPDTTVGEKNAKFNQHHAANACMDSSRNSASRDERVSSSSEGASYQRQTHKSNAFKITSISRPTKSQDFENLQFESSREKNKIVVRIGFGNITDDRSQTLVNNVDDQLKFSGKLAKSILNKAGDDIKDECRKNYKTGTPLEVGHVIRTSSGKIKRPVIHILHVVGPNPPRYKSDDSDTKMALFRTFRNCFQHADEKLQSTSLCLPPIGSSAYGIQMVTYSLFEALESFDASIATIQNRDMKLKNIRIVDTDVPRLKEMVSIFRTLINQ